MRFIPGRPGGPDSVIDVLDAQQRATRRAHRRWLSVFGGVTALCLLAGQAWNYARPDAYRASLRLRIAAAEPTAAASPRADGAAPMPQLLTSRPLLDPLARGLAAVGQPLAADADEAATRLQAMLQVQPLNGGEWLLLATGTQPGQLAAVLNAWPALIRAELIARHQRDTEARLAATRQALAQLALAADRDGGELPPSRVRSDSQAGRDDSDALALRRALQTLAAAQARMQALRDSTADERSQVVAQEAPALAALEVRASLVREELRDMAHTDTAAFMATDPRARALRAELAELERQIARQRKPAPSPAVDAAQQVVAAAQAEVARLRARQAATPPAAQVVAPAPPRASGAADDPAQRQTARRELLDRVARLTAEGRRLPTVTVLSPATVPTAPLRPDHPRDTLRVLGGALLAGLLATGLVALFNRPSRAP